MILQSCGGGSLHSGVVCARRVTREGPRKMPEWRDCCKGLVLREEVEIDLPDYFVVSQMSSGGTSAIQHSSDIPFKFL